MALTQLLLYLLILCILLVISNAQCSSYSDESSCTQTNGRCNWIGNGFCACASPPKLDILFGVDSAGSIGWSGFQMAKQLIERAVLEFNSGNRIGFYPFATTVNKSRNLQYWDYQSLESYVRGLYWSGGWDSHPLLIEDALAEFANNGQSNRDQVLIMTTDATPCMEAECPVEMCNNLTRFVEPVQQSGIKVVVWGIGDGLTDQYMKCLTQVNGGEWIPIASYSETVFNAIMGYGNMPDIFCPIIINKEFKVTEVKADNKVSTWDSRWGRFVEIYNSGVNFTLNQIEITGLISMSAGSGPNVTLTQGQYAVFYDASDEPLGSPTVGSTPSCHLCSPSVCDLSTCSDTSAGYLGYCFCGNAVYIACSNTNDGATNCSNNVALTGSQDGCLSCTFNDDMDNENWNITFSDTNGDINQVIYDSSMWTTANDGFSYELAWKGFDNSFGTHWIRSCDIFGTPGSDPFSQCPAILDDCRRLSIDYCKQDSYCDINTGNCKNITKLRVTEIKAAKKLSTWDSRWTRFVEIYNYGDEFMLNDIEIDGLITMQTSNASNINIAIQKGQYVVFYDASDQPLGLSTVGSTPTCHECNSTICAVSNCDTTSNCDLSKCNNTSPLYSGYCFCDNAVYIACGNSNDPISNCDTNVAVNAINGMRAENGCSVCTFNDNMNRDNWNITLSDNRGIIDQVIYENISYFMVWNNTENDAFSYELDIDNNSWIQSCTIYGTPGSDKMKDCSKTCNNFDYSHWGGGQCQQGYGDNYCDITSGQCVCGEGRSPFCITPEQCLVCNELPGTDQCTVQIMVNESNGQEYALYNWTMIDIPETEYTLTYFNGSKDCGLNLEGDPIVGGGQDSDCDVTIDIPEMIETNIYRLDNYYELNMTYGGYVQLTRERPSVCDDQVCYKYYYSYKTWCEWIEIPSYSPTADPTTEIPTDQPTNEPTKEPTLEPSDSPSISPTNEPTLNPTTEYPTMSPSEQPTDDLETGAAYSVYFLFLKAIVFTLSVCVINV